MKKKITKVDLERLRIKQVAATKMHRNLGDGNDYDNVDQDIAYRKAGNEARNAQDAYRNAIDAYIEQME